MSKMRTSFGLMGVFGLLAALLLFGGLSGAQKGKPTPPPSGDPAIVYYSYQAWGHTNLMVMDENGANQKVIQEGIKAGYGHFEPSWAPDGTWIVFGRTDGECYADSNGIFMVKKDGTGLCRVTTMVQVPWVGFGYTRWRPPVAQPDGILPLLFADSQAPSLFMVDDVCPAQPMGLASVPPCTDFTAMSWSPDGTRLAARAIDNADPANPVQRMAIFRLELSPNGWIVVLENDFLAAGPLKGADIYGVDWSPTTNKLAVSAYAVGGNYDIWVIDLDGNIYAPVNITATTDAGEVEPSWSPDGTHIVYSRNGTICKMKADGTERVQLAAPGRKQQLRGPDWRH